MPRNIINTLKKIGLTDTESQLYITGLAYDSIEVSELVKQTTINRTTIYHALETLIQKGLVTKHERPDKSFFTMTDPKKLEKLFEEKISLLELQKNELLSIIPLLQNRHKEAKSDFRVIHYEGIEGIKLAVEEALYCKDGHWDIIAPKINFFSDFDRDYAKYFMNARRNRGVTARSLWETDIIHKNLNPTDIEFRHPRILPEIMHGKFNSVIILFDNKILLISSLKEKSAILIQSRDLHETLSAIFEGLYIGSQPIKITQ
ncbi:hypothetical protein COT97_02970 [Candidatus Falkowbacteria bacterium CG10_big_fil_rev_8_21_14_0_10_39_11]|uniref:Transcription regulator TrmB N-terminal domain-containing protein n=1 Tax=Candidatus Falkowbacteria bacterium CG10_big_fil_rev_8_21_14_0_10_39_11 TaxID=1974565 RepID=A0A2H0V503_9BACT|nr:MAG: hypothetical protein COT97_02970 [Candidatus Falkowbacteria bacterium CG10_big_fil_rev_8_21_14_0_10_39_11]